jgi:hypothetical protein
MARAGDTCSCGHYYTVVNTKQVGNVRIQYLGCRNCGKRPAENKSVKTQ